MTKTTNANSNQTECSVHSDACKSHNMRKWLSVLWLVSVFLVIASCLPSVIKRDKENSQDRMLRMVLANLEQAVIVVDDKMNIELFSGAAETMFDAKADQVEGQSMNWMVPPESIEAHLGGVKRFWSKPDDLPRTMVCMAMKYNGEPIGISMRFRGVQDRGKWRLVVQCEPEEIHARTIEIPTNSESSQSTPPP